eukprot:TRINITY_DN32680_c0_g1_i1.p2 TRINITY_DN32680_c0_g1~~TRINITY_DN32680_c0_g1_i1.p2  ORF type:complete len:191 (-),score=11.68 TRINITY_DN32680_c0_g1_i1:77-649(-)
MQLSRIGSPVRSVGRRQSCRRKTGQVHSPPRGRSTWVTMHVKDVPRGFKGEWIKTNDGSNTVRVRLDDFPPPLALDDDTQSQMSHTTFVGTSQPDIISIGHMLSPEGAVPSPKEGYESYGPDDTLDTGVAEAEELSAPLVRLLSSLLGPARNVYVVAQEHNQRVWQMLAWSGTPFAELDKKPYKKIVYQW